MEELKFTSIKIQDLEPIIKKQKEQYEPKYSVSKMWFDKKCRHYDDNCNCQILYYKQNSTVEEHPNGDSFYSAFVKAYNNHEDLILSPDDI